MRVQPLGWPGLDTALTSWVFRLLRPVWALGIRPRSLARMLVTVAMVMIIFWAVFGISVGVWPAGIFLVFAAGCALVLTRVIPAWDRINEELSSGSLSLMLFLHLRLISHVRSAILVGAIAGNVALIILIHRETLLSATVPFAWILIFVGLHVTTVMGDPPRSILRRAIDRVREMRSRMVLNPQLG